MELEKSAAGKFCDKLNEEDKDEYFDMCVTDEDGELFKLPLGAQKVLWNLHKYIEEKGFSKLTDKLNNMKKLCLCKVLVEEKRDFPKNQRKLKFRLRISLEQIV